MGDEFLYNTTGSLSLKNMGIKKIVNVKKDNKIQLKKTIKKVRFVNSPLRVIVISFLSVIIIGTILLTMPFSSKNGEFTSVIDAFFTATSATCVTGLIIADTFTKWTIFGQIVILCLIQVGGLGLVTLVTFFNVAIGRKIGLKNMQLAQESISCPSFSEINSIIKKVVGISILIEFIGAVLLSFEFVSQYGKNGIFISIFLAVSAFCNAGFDILGFQGQFSSLTNYNDNPYVLTIIGLLIIFGGLGFLVWNDLITKRKGRRLLFHTKIVVIVTVTLIVFGGLFFMLAEWNNPETLGNLNTGEKVTASFFQSVTCRTAGYNSIDQGGLTGISKIVSIILMFIGAAPGSTGGGIKVTTVVVIAMTIICAVKGENGTRISKRCINQKTVNRSVAIVFCAILAICISSMVIYFTNDPALGIGGSDAFFESTSAFATVGLSTGITPNLNTISKIFVSLTMFIGRVGPVSLLFSLIMKQTPVNKNTISPEANILVG